MDEKNAILMLQKVKAGILMLQEIQRDLEKFLGKEVLEEDENVKAYVVEETWLGDDGKIYKASTPYIKAKTWYCCGQPLERSEKNGKKTFHCAKCGANYSA